MRAWRWGARAQAGVLLEVKDVPYPGFEHGRQSEYRLSAAHVFVQCTQCHVRSRFWGTPSACEACHMDRYTRTTAPNHEEAGFPADCVQCHRTSSFTVTRFGHGQGQFPLVGKHASAGCVSCHKVGATGKPDKACSACHLAQYESAASPNHKAAGYPTGCDACHTPVGWKPAKVDHPRQRFPLEGKHAALACSGCHASRRYLGTVRECSGCHLDDYNATNQPSHLKTGFPTTCQNCHTTAGWKPAQFSHSFPIYSGKHAGKWSSCGDCHIDSANFKSISCSKCHPKSKMDEDHHEVKGYLYDFPAFLKCHPAGTKP